MSEKLSNSNVVSSKYIYLDSKAEINKIKKLLLEIGQKYPDL